MSDPTPAQAEIHLVQHLENIPELKDLTDSQRVLLSRRFRREHYAPRQVIVHQGDLGNRLFVVVSGVVNLRHTDPMGLESSIGVLAPPGAAPAALRDYWGEQMFTTQEAYDFAAQSVHGCDVETLERQEFDRFVEAHPEVVEAMTFIQTAERKRTRGFKWVGAGETVATVMHKHWWALLPGLLRVLSVIVLAVILNAGSAFFRVELQWYFAMTPWVIAALLLAWALYDWWNDEYIVTNHRIAHVERVLLIQELREGIPLDKIQGVLVHKQGLTAWLGVGRLIIQSAGREEGDVVFETVNKPEVVRQLIMAQQARVRARDAAEQRERDRDIIEEELRGYFLPQTLAHESAAPPPLAKSNFRAALRARVQAWVGKEIHHGSMIIWRKHWIVLVRQVWRWFVALFFLTLVLVVYALVPGIQIIPAGVHLFVGLILLLIFLGGLIWEWADWRNDIYAVTDTHVIDSERLPLGLRERSTTAPLDQVQDVKIDVPGIMGWLLDFGDVKVETAGKSGQMNFHSVRSPRQVQEKIFQRLQEYKIRRAELEAALRRKGIIDAIVSYHRVLKEEEQLIQSPTGAPPTAPAPDALSTDASAPSNPPPTS